MLAAYRCGMRGVILPKGNASDLLELAPEVKDALVITLVEDVSDVIAHLFLTEDVQYNMTCHYREGVLAMAGGDGSVDPSNSNPSRKPNFRASKL